METEANDDIDERLLRNWTYEECIVQRYSARCLARGVEHYAHLGGGAAVFKHRMVWQVTVGHTVVNNIEFAHVTEVQVFVDELMVGLL